VGALRDLEAIERRLNDERAATERLQGELADATAQTERARARAAKQPLSAFFRHPFSWTVVFALLLVTVGSVVAIVPIAWRDSALEIEVRIEVRIPKPGHHFLPVPIGVRIALLYQDLCDEPDLQDRSSCKELGDMFMSGVGGERSIEGATRAYYLACTHGDMSACAWRP
jgi:hypothetical protein